MADFNGDGKPDLAVANHNVSNDVSVLLGNGDGTFQTAQNFAAGLTPSSVAVGDLNGDGKPDLAVANNSRDSGTVSVLLGNGDGTFQAAQNFAVGADAVHRGGGGLQRRRQARPGRRQHAPRTASACCWATATAPSRPPRTSPPVIRLGPWRSGTSTATASPTSPWQTEGGNSVSVLLNQFVTTTAVSGPASATYGQSVTYTATVMSGAAPVTAGTVTFLDGNTPLSPALCR